MDIDPELLYPPGVVVIASGDEIRLIKTTEYGKVVH